MSNSKVANMAMIAGLDIGNGYVKGSVSMNGGERTTIDFPSCVAVVNNTHDIKTPLAQAGYIIEDIFNEMECAFDSKAVDSTQHRLPGKRGIASGNSMREFDVTSTKSKADDDLSSMLTLGCLAGKALQSYYKEHQALPADILRVTVYMAIALPITEYKAKRKMYAQKFMDGTHMVSIYNFEQTIRVELTVVDVQVLAEGASAQYAIINYGVPLMEALLADLRAQGETLPGITANDVLAAENTVGIDIGEGTVNFPVFQNGKFNPDVSATFAKGYGTVLERARTRLVDAYRLPFNSRKALADFILKKPSPMNQQRYNRVMEVVRQECEDFSYEVANEFVKVMNATGVYTEVVYVYGGGSSGMKEFLYPKLIAESKRLGGSDVFYPILYLDARYSRNLNREGLFLVEQSVVASR